MRAGCELSALHRARTTTFHVRIVVAMGMGMIPHRRLRRVLADHLPLHHRLFFAQLFARLLLVRLAVQLERVVDAITRRGALAVTDGEQYG